MIRIRPEDMGQSVFDRIGKQWMLVTARAGGAVNTMTASWGGLGILWNRPVAFIFVRPQRYTYEFLENSDRFTLSFLPESQRAALNLCGSKSGRDLDKIAAAGLTLRETKEGCPAFAQSELTLVCEKLYVQDLQGCGFQRPELLKQFYPQNDLHRMYVGEILGVEREDRP